MFQKGSLLHPYQVASPNFPEWNAGCPEFDKPSLSVDSNGLSLNFGRQRCEAWRIPCPALLKCQTFKTSVKMQTYRRTTYVELSEMEGKNALFSELPMMDGMDDVHVLT